MKPPGKIASPVSSADHPRSSCMYRVRMNWKPNHPPTSAIAPRFARTSEPVRRMPSRTSGDGVRISCHTKAARMATAPPNVARVWDEVHPASGAWTTVNTSSSIPVVIPSAPARSNLPGTRAPRPSPGTRRIAARSVSSASGTGKANTHRHPISVKRPLNTSPSENPVAPVAV
jgi:hypothetical protein